LNPPESPHRKKSARLDVVSMARKYREVIRAMAKKKYVEVNNLSQRLAGTCFSEKRTDVSEGGGHSKDAQQVGTIPRIEDGSE
jgi:hypothetical protein